MVAAAATPFSPPAISWRRAHPRTLPLDPDLAVILRQPQLSPAETMACWQRFQGALDRLRVGVDLVVAGSADAERLSGSRWLRMQPCCWRSFTAICAYGVWGWITPIRRTTGASPLSSWLRNGSKP